MKFIIGFIVVLIAFKLASRFGLFGSSDSAQVHPMSDVAHALGAQSSEISKIPSGHTIQIQLNEALVSVTFKSWSEQGEQNYMRQFSSMETAFSGPGIPGWFSFSIKDSVWSMRAGEHTISSEEQGFMLSIMSASSCKFLREIGEVSLDSSGAHAAYTIESSLVFMHEVFVEQAVRFVRLIEEIAQTIPRTPELLEHSIVGVSKDAAVLSAVYGQILKRMGQDEHAEELIHDVVERGLGDVIARLFGSDEVFDSLVMQAQWLPQRAIEVTHAVMLFEGMSPNARQRLVGKTTHMVPLQSLTLASAKSYSAAMCTLLAHHLGVATEPEEIAQVGDTLVPLMAGADAVQWLVTLGQEAPLLCDYDRVGAVLKHKMPPAQRAPLVDVLVHVFEAQPELVAQPRWLKRTLGLLQFANLQQARAMAPILVQQLNPSHFKQIKQVADDPMFRDHPIHLAIGPVLKELERRAAGGGALSISDAPEQAGQLTSVVEQGALSSSTGSS